MSHGLQSQRASGTSHPVSWNAHSRIHSTASTDSGSFRKHTGERPFTCHCGKQFSRLDNLRQHAQTVHSDKAEENEAMMRDLSTIHATMSAKAGTSTRGGRRSMKPRLKQEADEEDQPDLRPDTSTGIEGDYGVGNHSFRDSPDMDSFRSFEHQQHDSFRGLESFRGADDSFRPFTSTGDDGCFRPSTATVASRPTTSFGLSSNISSRPGTSSGRPRTSGGSLLPPLSAIVSHPSALQSAESSERSSFAQFHPHSTQRLLPLRRPDTSRPGTAPANFFSDVAPPSSADYPSRMAESPSPPGGNGGLYGDSPFSFHAPEPSAPTSVSHPSSLSHGRKRSFCGEDGPNGGDYQSESRPQSRRLSVMELLNNESDSTLTELPRPRTATARASAAFVSPGAYVPTAVRSATTATPSPPPPAAPAATSAFRTATARFAFQFPERPDIRADSATAAAITITTNGGVGIHEEATASAVFSSSGSSVRGLFHFISIQFSLPTHTRVPTANDQRSSGKLSALASVAFSTTNNESKGSPPSSRFAYSMIEG